MSVPVDSSLSSEDFIDLKRRLCKSNHVYRCIAVDLRSIRLKNGARHRARELGLRINIGKAKACPQKAVSVLPLPILETSPSPMVSLSFKSPNTRQHYVRHKRNWTLPSLTMEWSPLSQAGRSPSVHSPTKSLTLRLSAIPNGNETTATCPHDEASFLDIPLTGDPWAYSEDTTSSSSASDSAPETSSSALETPLSSRPSSIFNQVLKRKAAGADELMLVCDEHSPKYQRNRWSGSSVKKDGSSRRNGVYIG